MATVMGFLVPMTPIGDEHAACVIRVSDLLYERLARRVWVSVQNAIAIAHGLPQPDVVVLRRQPDCYRSGKPQPADIYLIIEVADTSLRRDRLVVPGFPDVTLTVDEILGPATERAGG